MNQDMLKRAAAEAALAHITPHTLIGVGSGSTVNYFIDALAKIKHQITATVASSEATHQRLARHGIPVIDLNDVEHLPIYIDGADEINPQLQMIKGGGGALTREKIIAAVAQQFICIADNSKQVKTLGRFPLPVEVIPIARQHVARQLTQLGGTPRLRAGFVTDNGNQILDTYGLSITNAPALETTLNQITGIVTNGLFALRRADILLLASETGVETLTASQ